MNLEKIKHILSLRRIGDVSQTPHERDAETGLYLPSAKFRDAAFTYTSGAGSPGDVNRAHPVSVSAYIQDATSPANLYGQPVTVDSSSHKVRRYTTADANTTGVVPWGITVRPYPIQQPTAASGLAAPAAFGNITPPATGPIDVMHFGFILVQLGDGQITGAVLGGAVYIWCAATAGHDVLGSVTTTTTAASVAALSTTRFYFHGVEDSSGVVEVRWNL